VNKTGKKIFSAVVALALAASVTAAISAPVSAHSRTASVKTLRWYGLSPEGDTHWITTLDPAWVTASDAYNVMNQVYSNLVKLLPNGTIVPGLAKSWSVSKNHLTYTFFLRSGLKFSNGDPLTAHDVAYTFYRTLAPSTASPVALLYDGHIAGAKAYNGGKSKTMSGIHVVSNTEIKLTLNQPIVFFLKTLSYPTADVVDKKVVGSHAVASGAYISNTCVAGVGDGPFKFKCLNSSTDPNHANFFTGSPAITLVPNPKYYGRVPHIDIYMPIISSNQVNYSKFQQGGIDITVIPAAYVKGDTHKTGFSKFASSVVDYMTPNEHPDSAFQSLHCRLALAYAINRNTVNNKILRGTQTSTYQILPENIPGYTTKFITNASWSPHYNLPKAKQEYRMCASDLAKKHKSSLLNNIVVPTQGQGSVDLTAEYNEILKEFGVAGFKNMHVKSLSFPDWVGIVAAPGGLDKTPTGSYPLVENLWIEDYPDAQDYTQNLLSSTSNYDIGYFHNSKFDSLSLSGNVTVRPSLRASIYQKAEKIALWNGAWIAVGNQILYALVNPKVHGLVGSAAYGIMVPKNDDWANVTIS